MSEDAEFAAGLVPYRKTLAEIREKKAMPPTEENPFDDDEESPEETPDPPPAPQPQRAQPPRVKKQRRKKAEMQAARAEAEAASAPEKPRLLDTFEAGTEGFDPSDAMTAWPEILADARAQGMGPEYIGIRVKRTGEGFHPTAPTWCGTIEGETVEGDDNVSSGQALVDYVTNVIHLPKKGPAKYKLGAFLKSGKGNFNKMMTIRLSDPDEIRAERKVKDDYLRAQRVAGMAGVYAPRHTAAPPLPQMPQMPVMPQMPPAPAPSSPLDGMRQWMQFQMEWEQYRQNMQAAGQPAPPPPPQIVQMPAPQPQPPPGPRLTPEESQLIEEAKFTRFLEKGGYVKAGVGAPAAPTAVAQAAQDPVAAIKNLLGTFKAIKNMEGEVGELFGVSAAEDKPDKEPEEVLEAPKIVKLPIVKAFGRDVYVPHEPEGVVDFITRFIPANLETTGDLGMKMLGGVAKAVDGTSFGRVLEKLAAQGGPPAQLAAQARVLGLAGTGPSPAPMNGAPPMMRPPRGPQA